MILRGVLEHNGSTIGKVVETKYRKTVSLDKNMEKIHKLLEKNRAGIALWCITHNFSSNDLYCHFTSVDEEEDEETSKARLLSCLNALEEHCKINQLPCKTIASTRKGEYGMIVHDVILSNLGMSPIDTMKTICKFSNGFRVSIKKMDKSKAYLKCLAEVIADSKCGYIMSENIEKPILRCELI